MNIEADRTTNPEYIEEATRIGSAMKNTAEWMMQTLFQKNTWDVRQLGTYGIAILNESGGTELYDLPPELDAMITQIKTDLGDRLIYFESAYRFRDALWGGSLWTEMILDPRFIDGNNNPNTNAEKYLAKSKKTVEELTSELETFLGGDAKHAFTITLDTNDLTHPSYKIEDLTLKPAEIRTKWAELQAAVFTKIDHR